MKKDFRAGDRLAAQDLQDMANSIDALEAGMALVVPGGRGAREGRAPLACYKVDAAEVLADVSAEESVTEANLDVPGLLRGIEYGQKAKINKGRATLPFPAARDWDDTYTAGADGVVPLPVMAKGVRDADGRVWKLAELITGPEFAATLARCTLPDGTVLELKLHTENGGTVMCFGLTSNGYYY